jgi:hypothetical protein
VTKLLNRIVVFSTIGFVLLALAISPGCNKDRPCKGIVTVNDAAGMPMSGVEVTLEPSDGSGCTGCITAMTASTDASGKVNFETQLPKIMDILVDGTPTGKVVRFEEGQTDEVIVP